MGHDYTIDIWKMLKNTLKMREYALILSVTECKIIYNNYFCIETLLTYDYEVDNQEKYMGQPKLRDRPYVYLHLVRTVPTFNLHLVGIVPTFSLHLVGIVPTFNLHLVDMLD